MKTTMYKQCRLEKVEGNSKIERMIWGPSKHAIEGKVVKVEEDDGSWTQGWTVVSASGVELEERYVRNLSHAHTRQRRASDI